HLEDHLIVGPGPLRTGVADVDAVGEHGAVDAHEAVAVALEVGADELPGGPLQDPDDPPGRAEGGLVGLARDAHQDGVAGGGVQGVALADADLRPGAPVGGVGPDVADPGAGAAVGPGDGAVGRGLADGLVLAQLDAAFAEQFAQGA